MYPWGIALPAGGARYWADYEGIGPGAALSRAVEKALANSRHVLACYSRNQLASGWCRREIGAFLNENMDPDAKRKVLPLILDDLEPHELPLFARDIAWVRYGDEEGYRRLLERLGR